ncbi:uncharacterized protein LOC124291041 isoform X2 [Haliotis rubra]|uniref:uncharacterized protein LOC124291041 isoform X2 n=1 Tax=Haliotis rubra TaxID=36100 RepID=UPI001EE5A1CA|nr:uncharacterized protein LOC124291041 isoform X2 [Haliotis rubra]
MASRGRTKIAIIGLILTSLGLLFLIISMCTPNWLESLQERRTGFGKLGIWEACFNNYVNEKDSLGKRYNGCHSLLSFEYRSIYEFLNPAWLLAIQVLMVLTLMIMMVCLVFVIMYFVKCCPANKEKRYVMFSFIFNFTAGTFIGISVILFGIKADTDRQWLPHPDSNYLSWSFGFAVLSAFFALFAGMCLLVEWMRLNQEENNKARRQNMSLTSKPATRY